MREGMAQLTPLFSTNRRVRQYMEHHYFPAASAYRERAVNSCALGRNVINSEQTLKQKWATLHCGNVKVQTIAAQNFFETEVHLNDLDQKAVRVELYADGINGSDPIRLDANCPARRAAMCVARLCLRTVRPRTTRRV